MRYQSLSKYYTYILRCSDNSLYTGITTDIERRFKEHQEKRSLGAKYTHHHEVIKIEIVFSSSNRSKASKLEYEIKRLKKEEKERIIRTKNLDILKEKIEQKNYDIVENMD